MSFGDTLKSLLIIVTCLFINLSDQICRSVITNVYIMYIGKYKELPTDAEDPNLCFWLSKQYQT